jgi:hypothetical protein
MGSDLQRPHLRRTVPITPTLSGHRVGSDTVGGGRVRSGGYHRRSRPPGNSRETTDER